MKRAAGWSGAERPRVLQAHLRNYLDLVGLLTLPDCHRLEEQIREPGIVKGLAARPRGETAIRARFQTTPEFLQRCSRDGQASTHPLDAISGSQVYQMESTTEWDASSLPGRILFPGSRTIFVRM